jgi:hypothetical protein
MMAPRIALHEAAGVRRRMSFSLKNRFRIRFLLRDCHGRAMLQFRRESVFSDGQAGLSEGALKFGWADTTK